MMKFLWTVFVFFVAWAGLGFIGSFFVTPFISFVVGFFVALWVGSKV